MKAESTRIFISDLPETATKEQIETAFGNYGYITSVEIKERKELGQKNTSLFFAYVTINIDPKSLNQCFNDFSKGKWLGQYIMLQIARESFLDRLKRERENNSIPNVVKAENLDENKCVPEKKLNGLKKNVAVKTVSSDSDSTSESEEDEEKHKANNKSVNNLTEESFPDLIVKNNKGKIQVSKSLKIESVGKEPIIKIEQKKKAAVNTSPANLKRLESLKILKQGYQNQKTLIKAALSNVDCTPKNKLVFEDTMKSVNSFKKTNTDIEKSGSKKDKNTLFNESDSEEDFEPNFLVKEHFQGKEGQKLLELQSKYKNDKRFTLDQRFLDSESVEKDMESNTKDEDISLEEEKKKEYAILEQVLGKTIVRKGGTQTTSNKSMLRFDPSQPEHSKYEIPKPPPEKKEKKRKRKNSDTEITEEKKADETAAPEVSKEVFYKVSDNLKQTFEEKKEFSLLSMFGQHEVNNEDMEVETQVSSKVNNKFQQEKNPFKYDSSDDEDETKHIVSKSNDIKSDASTKNSYQQNTRSVTSWTDHFFFKLDDYRLQEGFDFVEKMKLDDKTEFTKLRRDLKGIVKAKVRNNLRKNKPFKKKLGGNRKKKST